MNIWNILNITPTHDTKEVKKAYARQLKLNHPEENPQGYQQLREAYSAALEYSKNPPDDIMVQYDHDFDIPSMVTDTVQRSITKHKFYEKLRDRKSDFDQTHFDQTGSNESDFDRTDLDQANDDQTDVNQPDSMFHGETFLLTSPVSEFDEFMDKVHKIYDNPDTRKDIICWNELMNVDVVWKLEDRERLGYRMKDFLMEHSLLPKEVWELLDSYFYLSDMDEVLEAFVKQNLYMAVRSGKTKAVKGLLQNNADLEVTNNQGKTAIIYAARYGYYDIALELVNEKINLEAKDLSGRTAFIEAVLNEEPEIVKCLLEHGANASAADNNGKTALMYAAESEDITALELILKQGVDLEAVDNSKGKTALLFAVISNNEKNVELLLKHGANIEAKNKDGFSAFFSAVKAGNVTMLELLHSYGADINQEDQEGFSALVYAVNCSPAAVAYLVQQGVKLEPKSDESDALEIAIADNKLEALQYLIQGGADIKAWRSDAMNSLMLAALCGHEQIVKCLLDNGIPVNESIFDEDYGRECTALFYAAIRGQEAAARLLLDNGAKEEPLLNIIYSSSAGLLDRVMHLVEKKKADVNEVDEIDGATALMRAVKNNKKEVVQYLLEQGALINVEAKNMASPLIQAALDTNIEIMDLLIEQGADLELKSEEDGFTALLRCAADSNLASMEYLIEKGADLEARDIRGITPLIGAIINEKIDAVKYLIEQGADINVFDASGDNAMTYAIAVSQLSIVKLLIDHGADVNFIDEKGRTYLHLSAVFGDLDLLKFFLEKGLSLNDRGDDGNTVLLEAAENDHMNIVEYIITEEEDYDIKAKNKEGKTAYNFAVMNLNNEMMDLLMDDDAELSVEELREMIEALKSLL